MEDLWNLRTCFNRPPVQPSPLPTLVNQFDMNPGQLSHPYVQQEVCVIERTIRQEPVGPNMLNFGVQGFTPNKLRSELLAMVSGSQQHQLRSNYQPCITARSAYIASQPQLYQTNSGNSPAAGGWPLMSPSNLSSINRMSGIESSSAAADSSHSGQGLDLSVVPNGRLAAVPQDNVESNVLRTSGSELLKQNLNFSHGTHDQEVDANRQAPFPQWLTEIVSRRQRLQGGQALFSVNSDVPRTAHTIPDVEPVGSNHIQAAPASMGRPRVFCFNYAGVPLSGELCLTDSGRLGVICGCHNMHMSVTKFTQHAGIYSANPGETVFLEGGETLVQWRKMFFYQYGVKVPEDNVGWDWNDLDTFEAGQAKCKAVMTQSWQKEVDVSYNGEPVVKSRVTQVWDASLAPGNTSTLHATQAVSNTKYASVNCGQGGSDESREASLKAFCRRYRPANGGLEFGSSQFFPDSVQQSLSRSQRNASGNNPSYNSSELGATPVNEYFNFMNHGGQQYVSPPGQQLTAGGKHVRSLDYSLNRWNNPQEAALKDKDSSVSSFELRLGQPSQQTQPVGSSFPSSLGSHLPASSVEHHKALLYERVMQQVREGRLQQEIQNSACGLPRFSSNAGQVSEYRQLTNMMQQGYKRTGLRESDGLECPSGEPDGGTMNAQFMQSARRLDSTSLYPGLNFDANAEHLQPSVSQSSKPPTSVDCRVHDEQAEPGASGLNFKANTDQLRRSVALDTGRDSLKNSGTLMQLSKKIGNRLLESAIQSSYGYRSVGLEAPAALTTDIVNGKGAGESLPDDLREYGMPFLSAGVPTLNFPGQTDARPNVSAAGLGVLDENTSAARLRRGPSGAVSSRDHNSPSVDHPSLQKGPMDDSHIGQESGGHSVAQLSSEVVRDWAGSGSGRQWEVQGQHHQMVMDKQAWLQGPPEVEGSGLCPRVGSSRVLSSGLSEGQDGSAGCHDAGGSQSQAETLLLQSKVRPGKDPVAQEELDMPPDRKQDIGCTCFKCRKRGRALPRLSGQVCLKDTEVEGTNGETVKNLTRKDGCQKLPKKCVAPQRRHTKSSQAIVDRDAARAEMGMKSSLKDPDGQSLHWKDVSEEVSEGLAEAEPSESPVSGDEDLLSYNAAKGTQAIAGSSRGPTALSDVCSKSSENVLSGLSNEGHDDDMEESTLLAQAVGKPLADNGVLDEGSGIGKCSSSDGVEMGAVKDMNAVSTAADLSKRESPSSLGCPSSSNLAKRLLVKRGVHGGGQRVRCARDTEQNVAEPENVLNTSKVEKKRRRTMKWKRLDSDVGTGESKKGIALPSSEQRVEPKDLQNIEMGCMSGHVGKVCVGTFKLPSPTPAEKGAGLKRRRVPFGSGNPSGASVAQGKDTAEEHVWSGKVDGGKPEKKNETLVIRVPQGVNRQKATRAERTKPGVATPFVASCEDGAKITSTATEKTVEASAVDKSGTTRESVLKRNFASQAPSITNEVQLKGLSSLLTKNVRSSRIPVGRPSPRNGRMVSLSDIMKQPAEGLGPESREGLKAALKPKPEGKIQRKVESSVALVDLPPINPNQVKVPAVSEMELSIENNNVKVMHKEEARKVRSMWELTGKKSISGPGTEVFDFAEEGVASSRACKLDTASIHAESSSTILAPFSESSCLIPRSGRSARSNLSIKRNVEWHRSKDAQADAGKSDDEILAEEKSSSVVEVKFACDDEVENLERPSIHSRAPRLDPYKNATIPRKQDRYKNASYELPSPRKQVRSSRVGTKGIQVKDALAAVEASSLKRVHEPLETLDSNAKRRKLTEGPRPLEMVDSSANRPKPTECLEKIKQIINHSKDKASESMIGSSSGKDKVDKRIVGSFRSGKDKIEKKYKRPALEEDGKSLTLKKCKRIGSSALDESRQVSSCDVCGSSTSDIINKLVACGRCPVKVHQACYGVSKIPKGPWFCRTCKFNVINPVCVLCGYGGGAMTRVQKSRGFVHGLLQAWRGLDNARDQLMEDPLAAKNDNVGAATATVQSWKKDATGDRFDKVTGTRGTRGNGRESCTCGKAGNYESFCNACSTGYSEDTQPNSHSSVPHGGGNLDIRSDSMWRSRNTITAVGGDAAAKQWAHMVCTLWMPGTRCLNLGTMGVFDVSGVALARRKLLCSICKRKGGSCIQCRVPKCPVPFHAWCAHEKGLLQTEAVEDGSNQVGFFGTCLHHGNAVSGEKMENTFTEVEVSRSLTGLEASARTEEYKGRQSLEERAKLRQQQLNVSGSTAVSPEQIAAWLRINDRKTSTRRFIKPPNSVMKYDHREYLRFKQKKGWRRLAVYKSGIHALGLYTTEFIAEGEVVVEYVGEIVGLRVADKREADYHSGKRVQYQGACYLFRIDTEQIIDATRKGGIARFVNHSCSPNCVAKVICVDNQKKGGLMDTQPVNWGALDALVLDFAEAELLLDSLGDVISGLGNTSICHIIELIRMLIETGRITEALNVMQQHVPVALGDQRLLFRLHKQKFIELLRNGGADAHAQAIECSRTHLGPCALKAYPEAFEEFKHVLLALMYDKDDSTSPVAEEWSEVKRAELAATIATTLKAQLQAYDHVFSLTLRYLISIHNGYCLRQGVASPITHVAAIVLSNDRDPPAMPHEFPLEAPLSSENDMQGLANAVELPRQCAIDSLRYTGGDLLAAFKNELSRIRVNVTMLDELVHEYCVYRGLIEVGPNYASNGMESSSAAHLTDVLASGVVESLKGIGARGMTLASSTVPAQTAEGDTDVNKCTVPNLVHEHRGGEDEMENKGFEDDLQDSDQIADPSQMETSDGSATNACVMESLSPSATEVVGESISLSVANTAAMGSKCSTSGSSHTSTNGVYPQAQLNRVGGLNRSWPSMARRRWRGRQQLVVGGLLVGGLWESTNLRPQDHLRSVSLSYLGEKFPVPEDLMLERYRRALEIRQLASEGKTEEVIDEVHRLNPSFFEHNPQLLFQLKQVEFLRLVEAGNYSRALDIAQADLGPLAVKFPDLLRPLKETLLVLVRPRSQPALKPIPPAVLAAALQVALGASLGIAEPLLMKIMRATLYTHTQWFKLQMCTDPFADLLNITVLKDTESSTGSIGLVLDVKMLVGTGSCLSTNETGGRQLSDSRKEGSFDETSILTIMEFLALSRGEAIQLLEQNDGSIENVFAHLMS